LTDERPCLSSDFLRRRTIEGRLRERVGAAEPNSNEAKYCEFANAPKKTALCIKDLARHVGPL
jgi:hypothetical protein